MRLEHCHYSLNDIVKGGKHRREKVRQKDKSPLSLLKAKQPSEKMGLKLNIKKIKLMSTVEQSALDLTTKVLKWGAASAFR